jgi:hypothetical protein
MALAKGGMTAERVDNQFILTGVTATHLALIMSCVSSVAGDVLDASASDDERELIRDVEVLSEELRQLTADWPEFAESAPEGSPADTTYFSGKYSDERIAEIIAEHFGDMKQLVGSGDIDLQAYKTTYKNKYGIDTRLSDDEIIQMICYVEFEDPQEPDTYALAMREMEDKKRPDPTPSSNNEGLGKFHIN